MASIMACVVVLLATSNYQSGFDFFVDALEQSRYNTTDINITHVPQWGSLS